MPQKFGPVRYVADSDTYLRTTGSRRTDLSPSTLMK